MSQTSDFNATIEATAASDAATKPVSVFLDPNMPVDAEGRTYHLNTKYGEVAPRILSVGDVGRAERIAQFLEDRKVYNSSRGFVTHTGLFNGAPVSIVATGMGISMIDFVVRECRAVVPGKMAILRFGTCGGVNDFAPGDVVVASKGGVMIRRNTDAVAAAIEGRTFTSESGGVLSATHEFPYDVSQVIPADAELSRIFFEKMTAAMAESKLGYSVKHGLDATADSFYSSQGRTGNSFLDLNETLIDHVAKTLPELAVLEMETAHLYDLARASQPDFRIAASAACIVLASRTKGGVVSKEDMITMERFGGRAALETLTSYPL